ncbi:MAG: rhomboid family intramembrane serine protease [Candidatus Limnocylindrales bacterium]
MDSTTRGLGPEGSAPLPPGFDPSTTTPLDRAAAIAALSHADGLMEQSEPELALTVYSRAAEMPDRDVSAAGYYGMGNALYRLDRESEARQAWERATSFDETPVAYRAWRQVAAARVREGDMPGALDAYRQCEKRAPREDRAEIASRLGWLNKETGNAGAATRYFARSRGDALPPFMTYLIIAVTVVASWTALSDNTSSLGGQLELDKLAIAHGELYRLLSVTLVHGSLIHLALNMYALWFAGQLVERMYGSSLLLAFYLICAAAGSVASYAFGPIVPSVGASGAIFGLFGVVLVATRLHHAVLDQQSRMIASQIGVLIALNLAIGFSGLLNVDNYCHVGGLVAGLWLALVIAPAQVPTLASLWQGRRGGGGRARAIAVRVLGVGALLAVLGVGVAVGTSRWQADPVYHYFYGTAGSAVEQWEAVTAPAQSSVVLTIR